MELCSERRSSDSLVPRYWQGRQKVRNHSDNDSESDEDLVVHSHKSHKRRKLSALEEKNERVEKVIAALREKHANKFTTIQYRLWSEMVDVGTHKSLDQPPNIPAFIGRERRTSPVVVGELAKAITSQAHQSNTIKNLNGFTFTCMIHLQ